MQSFDELIDTWASAACQEWDYGAPPAELRTAITTRLPEGLRVAIAEAFASGDLEITQGHRFRPSGIAPSKGPYAFFSQSKTGVPAPNWEYFVQVAEYVRLARVLRPQGLRLDFEDDLMDVTVYDHQQLLWCIEVKEKAAQLTQLLAGIQTAASKIIKPATSPQNDSYRKAMYLWKHQPTRFSIVAIGHRVDFTVLYGPEGFELAEDLAPLG